MLACLALLGSLIMTCAIELANPSLEMVHSSAANFSSLELSALQDLYNRTGGEDWRWKSDSFGIPWNFSSNANPCAEDWQGMQCTLPPPFDTYHVANLSLPDYGLYGPIPGSLGQLYYLEGLDLYHNHLTGTVPFSSFNRTSLVVLNLTTNYITGTIPENLGTSLPRLTVLGLNENSLHGTIPSSLNLTYLKVLDLSNNSITGTIPGSLGHRLTKLTNLQISNTYLTGFIPISILDLTSLEVIVLNNNRITGTIPQRLGSMLPKLAYLLLHNNKLFGTMPDALGQTFPNLISLQVNNNLLVGSIPSSLSELTRLEILDLSYNTFTGQLQPAFNVSSQQKLITVVLYNNEFTGTLPESLLGNSHLEMLAMDNNCFHGTISPSLCSNINLEVLTLGSLSGAEVCRTRLLASLGSNGFILSDPVKGTVPACVFSLPKLQQLALLGNALTGTIPSNISFSPNLTSLLLSNNIFVGNIPQVVQQIDTEYLDLSYNNFNGGFNGRDTYISSQVIDVRYNLLSGMIPTSVQSLVFVNMLSGNLFVCNEERSDLPKADSAYISYQCGSNDFNKPMYAWLIVVISTLTGLLMLYHCRFVQYVNIQDILIYARQWLICLRDTKLPSISEVRQVGNRVTLVGALCAACIVCVGAPMYGWMTECYGTYTSQYAWAISLVLLSGVTPCAIGILLLFLALLVFVVMFARPRDTKGIMLHTSAAKASPTTCHVIVFCTVYFLVNLIIPVAANLYYLTIVVRSPSLQVTMSSYKFVWNSIVSPYLSRWLVYKLSKHRADFFTLELFVALLSNVIVPLFCVVILEPQCFFGVFVENPRYFFEYTDSANVAYTVKYSFPFRYQYLCTFTYMEYYASAFIYLSIFSAFGIPVYEMTLLFLYTRAAPGTYWYYLLRRYLPRILRPLETDPDKIPPRDIFRPYFDATKFFISQLTCLALILSLGVVSPPLAACLAVTMLATSAYTVLKVGRFLTNATEANQPKYIELIDEESRGVVTLQALSRAFWLLLSFSCAFMAPFLFDVLGSTEGFQSSYWVLIVVPLCPLVAYIMVRIWRYVRIKYGPKAFDVNDVNSSEYSNNGTGKAGENDNALEMSSVVMSPLVNETCKL